MYPALHGVDLAAPVIKTINPLAEAAKYCRMMIGQGATRAQQQALRAVGVLHALGVHLTATAPRDIYEILAGEEAPGRDGRGTSMRETLSPHVARPGLTLAQPCRVGFPKCLPGCPCPPEPLHRHFAMYSVTRHGFL